MKKEKLPDKVAPKMTIHEYEEKYSHKSNVKGAKLFIFTFAAAIGVLLFFCLFSLTMRVFEMDLPSNINVYAGIGTAAVSVLLYIFLFIVPLAKISKMNYFDVNVNAMTARQAKKHNKKVRHEIADRIIDLTAKVEGVGWYDSEIVGKLAIAQKVNDEQGVKDNLTALYNGSVKKNAKKMTNKAALKAAMYSAASQSGALDTVLVAFINFQLVKDLLYLYGFRPSDAKLVKIFGSILRNSLIAYGLGGVKIGGTVAQSMGESVKRIPLLGAAISTMVDSAVQGLTNGILTNVIGRQTRKYLSEEFRLQDVLDGIDIVETDEEFAETCKELEREIRAEKFAKAS